MNEWERITECFAKLSENWKTVTRDIIDLSCNAIRIFIDSLDIAILKTAAAYIEAKREHPEWVHKANYSKKKRTRKKYHDKIMRQYWRAENG